MPPKVPERNYDDYEEENYQEENYQEDNYQEDNYQENYDAPTVPRRAPPSLPPK